MVRVCDHLIIKIMNHSITQLILSLNHIVSNGVKQDV